MTQLGTAGAAIASKAGSEVACAASGGKIFQTLLTRGKKGYKYSVC